MSYQTIRVRFEAPICFLQFYRPEANNTINARLIEECSRVLEKCDDSITVVVLEGLPEVFCFGADFQGIHETIDAEDPNEPGPEPLYDLWLKLATGPFVTLSHVRGKVNAGGVGFVAASDVVIADQAAQFSLSELLFGLFPACVLPFLIRRVGFQKAHYLTLMTKPISAPEALSAGLVDACDTRSDARSETQSVTLLRKHLLRLRRLSKTGIRRYKHYMNQLDGSLIRSKPPALAANREVFSDPVNLNGIIRYVETGQFPWEA